MHGAIGYAVAAKRLMLALLREGVEVTWSPPVPGSGLGLVHELFCGSALGDPDLDPICNAPLEDDTLVVHMRPEYDPVAARLFPGRRILGHVAWGTDRLPRNWPSPIQAAERVLVPCEWNRRLFLAGGVSVPVAVVPHVAAPIAPLRERAGTARTFYTIGTWSARQALPRTIRAYREAFRSGEDVVPIVKTSPTANVEHRLRRYGWARYLWRAMRRTFRLPARRYSTPADLAERDTGRGGGSARVEVVSRELTDAEIHDLPRRGQRWAAARLEDAVRHLRDVHEHPDTAFSKAAELRDRILARFGEAEVVRRFLAALAES
jgi:hypothetical protein